MDCTSARAAGAVIWYGHVFSLGPFMFFLVSALGRMPCKPYIWLRQIPRHVISRLLWSLTTLQRLCILLGNRVCEGKDLTI